MSRSRLPLPEEPTTQWVVRPAACSGWRRRQPPSLATRGNCSNSTSCTTFDPATSLFVIWLFPNDVFRADANGVLPGRAWTPGGPLPEAGGLTNPANASALIANGVQNISYAVSELANAGAQHFLVPNMRISGRHRTGWELLTRQGSLCSPDFQFLSGTGDEPA